MRDTRNAFHLAIPCQDLEQAYTFYVTKLGCKLARRYEDRITLDFFGDQVVCHLSEDIVIEANMYPRHFGVTFYDRHEFDLLLRLVRTREIPFFQEPKIRFAGLAEEHWTFLLLDPSNNVLEFKYYEDPRMMY